MSLNGYNKHYKQDIKFLFIHKVKYTTNIILLFLFFIYLLYFIHVFLF